MRTAVAVILSLAFLSLLAPSASAGPECIQVYPWSELCQGDVGGFLCAFGVCPTVEPREPTLYCVDMVPASYLCSGNVGAFVQWYADHLPVDPRSILA